ncbi:SseB family protein [Schaalia suimastitidis]|uniref:SseB family protein n=1 Tax=Schaalia suimastitidis TaxID=121163 RepID=UPI00040B1127|nr:SseB family protein [Schaalia suimastitidis]
MNELRGADASRARPVPALTAEQRNNLAARLSRGTVDRQDAGQLLPLTASALAHDASGDAGAAQLEALVAALAVERVIVPIDVEADPRVVGAHSQHAGSVHAGWEHVDTPMGPCLAVYTSAEELTHARVGARPMPLKARTVALTALVETGGRIIVDPAGAACILPRPATAALAQGDDWLPPWRDAELLDQLREAAQVDASEDPLICDVHVTYAGQGLVRVVLDVAEVTTGPSMRAKLHQRINAIGRCPRLLAATDRVELTPRRVARQ